MSQKPPMKRTYSDPRVMAILNDLSQRPAMNGGFQKLAQQQEEQCAQIAEIKSRLQPVEEWVIGAKRGGKWVLGGIGAILVTVLGELVVQLVTHMHISLH